MKAIGKGPKAPRSHKPYVGDVGRSLDTGREKASATFAMVALSLVVGFVIGLAVWAAFWAASFLTNLLWVDARGAIAARLEAAGFTSWWLPLAFCTVGGVVIGLFTWKFGGAPKPLMEVMASVKCTGGYRLERPGASVVGFLLPLVFGGSVGPEAGLTGLIAAACTKIGLLLKAAGLRVKGIADVTVSAVLSAVFAAPFMGVVATAEDGMPADGRDPQDYDFRRRAKLVLYTASALGALGGIALFTSVFGVESGLPRFDGITPADVSLLWAIPCILVGYLGALLFHVGEFSFSRASAAMGERPILKPIIAGVVLGVLAIPLPFVLFPGEEQAFQVMESWQVLGAVVLLATGLAKCLATPLCLNFGWNGGHFFPLIFAGIAAGYGIACISGVDPMFCVAITTATLVAGVQRNALVALALLLLCFPVRSLVWMGIACLVGAVAPMPSALVAKAKVKER